MVGRNLDAFLLWFARKAYKMKFMFGGGGSFFLFCKCNVHASFVFALSLPCFAILYSSKLVCICKPHSSFLSEPWMPFLVCFELCERGSASVRCDSRVGCGTTKK